MWFQFHIALHLIPKQSRKVYLLRGATLLRPSAVHAAKIGGCKASFENRNLLLSSV